MEIFISRRR